MSALKTILHVPFSNVRGRDGARNDGRPFRARLFLRGSFAGTPPGAPPGVWE